MALAVLLAAAAAAGEARAARYLTQAEALEGAFPGARIERRALALTPEQVRAVERRARARLGTRLAVAYTAWRGDTLVGTAFFDTRIVRTMPGVFMVVVAPDSTIARIDVLAFHEPSEYLPPARWRGTFEGRRLSDRLWPRHEIVNLSGATLSARVVTESARLALAFYALVVAPERTAEAAGKR